MAERPSLAHLNVMVVEDNAHMRSLIRHILASLDVASVVEAMDGDSAMAVLENDRPHVIVCDWDMEPVDGISFVRALRRSADARLAVLPVLMLTSFTERDRVCGARDAGANDFLAKPVSVSGLYQRIHAMLTKPRPFVHCPTYFGPDRRRRALPHDGQDRRHAVPIIAFRPKPILF